MLLNIRLEKKIVLDFERYLSSDYEKYLNINQDEKRYKKYFFFKKSEEGDNNLKVEEWLRDNPDALNSPLPSIGHGPGYNDRDYLDHFIEVTPIVKKAVDKEDSDEELSEAAEKMGMHQINDSASIMGTEFSGSVDLSNDWLTAISIFRHDVKNVYIVDFKEWQTSYLYKESTIGPIMDNILKKQNLQADDPVTSVIRVHEIQRVFKIYRYLFSENNAELSIFNFVLHFYSSLMMEHQFLVNTEKQFNNVRHFLLTKWPQNFTIAQASQVYPNEYKQVLWLVNQFGDEKLKQYTYSNYNLNNSVVPILIYLGNFDSFVQYSGLLNSTLIKSFKRKFMDHFGVNSFMTAALQYSNSNLIPHFEFKKTPLTIVRKNLMLSE